MLHVHIFKYSAAELVQLIMCIEQSVDLEICSPEA